MKNIGYYNGKTGPIEEMMIPMNDRACYFADGVYDATCAKNGRIYLLEEHIDRFFNSAGLVRMDLGYTKAELAAILNGLVAQVEADEVFVYWQASRGTAKRNHIFPAGVKANLYATVTPAPLKGTDHKIKLITRPDIRFELCHIKTINLLPAVLAAQEAEEAGCDECVLHRGEWVTECAHSNVSIIQNGILKTHPTDQFILPGIARAHMIKAAKKLGIPVDERAFTLDELRRADEVIVTSSSKFFLLADTLDGAPCGGKAPALADALNREIMAEFHAYVGA